NYFLIVRDLLSVDPNLRAVVDSWKFERVGGVASRRGEYGPIPPVLLVQILRNLLQHVHADIKVGVDTILLQYLENRRGHAMDRMPRLVPVIGLRNGCTTSFYIFRSGQFPVLRQLHFPWSFHLAECGQGEQAK